MMPGLFIAFEGGDGAGKSTQATILEAALQREGYCTALLHEPGSTSVGDYLRQYLIDNRPISPLAELLLFEASRAEIMAERIRPELKGGAVIICDRFAGSTIAYQGYGRGLDLETIQWLNDFASGGCYPDLTILLDVDPVIGLERANNRLFQLALPIGDVPDRFEEEEVAFHDRVRRGFLKQAESNTETWRRIDGNLSMEEVAAAVWSTVSPLLENKPVQAPGLLKGIDSTNSLRSS